MVYSHLVYPLYLMARNAVLLEFFTYSAVTLVHFTGQNLIPKTVYCTDGMLWSVKYVFGPNSLIFRRSREEAKKVGENRQIKQKLHFCVRPWLLHTILNFSTRWPTDTTVFYCLFSF